MKERYDPAPAKNQLQLIGSMTDRHGADKQGSGNFIFAGECILNKLAELFTNMDYLSECASNIDLRRFKNLIRRPN